MRVVLGKITRSNCSLQIPFEKLQDEEDEVFLSSDTRFRKKFRAKIYIFCDDDNSSHEELVEFDPTTDSEWSAVFLAEYDDLDFRRSVVMPAANGPNEARA